MAIITCPECGQNPVSDRATSCPKCGCPISAANAPIAPANPSAEPAGQARTIQEERTAQLRPFDAILHDWDTEFPESSVSVNEASSLEDFVNQTKGWCEALAVNFPVHSDHVDLISKLSGLKSLKLYDTALNDEALLRISKMPALRRLVFLFPNKGYTQEVGWLQLARLSRLEYLSLPAWLGPNEDDDEYDKMKAIKRELQRRLPNTIIK